MLDVAAVMQRYRIRDRRAARRLMDDAGGFLVAGRLVVRWDDLEAFERRQREDRRRASDDGDARSTARSIATTRRPSPAKKPLTRGWWRS